MNRKVIQKVIDELSKDTPSIPYVLGMLETLLETLPKDPESVDVRPVFKAEPPQPQEASAVSLDRLAEIKRLVGDVN